jgi:hypothetical protein
MRSTTDENTFRYRAFTAEHRSRHHLRLVPDFGALTYRSCIVNLGALMDENVCHSVKHHRWAAAFAIG